MQVHQMDAQNISEVDQLLLQSNSLLDSPIEDNYDETKCNELNTYSKKIIEKDPNMCFNNSLKDMFISSKPKKRDTENDPIMDDDFLNSLLDNECSFPNPKRRKIISSCTRTPNPSLLSIQSDKPVIQSNQSRK